MKFLFAFILGLWIFIYIKSYLEQYRGKLDAREAAIRRRVRQIKSRTLEFTVAILLVSHFFAQPLSTPLAAAIIGLSVWVTSTAANFYFRRA